MTITLPLSQTVIGKIKTIHRVVAVEAFILFIACIVSIVSTAFFYAKDYIIAYGDAESHVNISKRVIDSVTPGFAQLGGIWLPLPHLLMMPFTYFDVLWRTGFAGAIVSSVAFCVICVMLYKLTLLFTHSKLAGFFAFLLFAANPNILYMQTTPMTELLLLAFFTLSTYFFILFLKGHFRDQSAARKEADFLSLLLAAFFGFLASLTRYDGWFLVLFEALVLVVLYMPHKKYWSMLKGHLVLFSTLAFFGIALWLAWGLLILGDPLYFTNSEFSAKTQQLAWLKRGELPAYHNPAVAFLYYLVTTLSNVGVMSFFMAIVGFYLFLSKKIKERFLICTILFVPFVFNVVTLFLGQSVIFIPHLTPVSFEWRLFNVRYGIMMVPVVAFFIAYLFHTVKPAQKVLIVFLLFIQLLLFASSYAKVITLADGTEGLSRAKQPSAQQWLYDNYDNGLVLIDDYVRSLSIIRANIPMENIIYLGNKPYWEESLAQPQTHAKWIIMQKDDAVWQSLFADPQKQAVLYKYFEKAYESPEILIFKRMWQSASTHQ